MHALANKEPSRLTRLIHEGKLELGGTFALHSLDGPVEWTSRLIEVGFVPGESCRLLHCLPFGGPIVIEVRGTTVALRRDEANTLKVEI